MVVADHRFKTIVWRLVTQTRLIVLTKKRKDKSSGVETAGERRDRGRNCGIQKRKKDGSCSLTKIVLYIAQQTSEKKSWTMDKVRAGGMKQTRYPEPMYITPL